MPELECSGMLHKITPKTRRNFYKILPFGVIWLLVGWVFLISERLYVNNRIINDEIEIVLTPKVFLFASFCIFLLGIQIGLVENFVWPKRFISISFRKKIIIKFLIYMFMLALAIAVIYPIATMIELGIGINNPLVWERASQFMASTMFLNALLQLSVALLLCTLYSAISEHLGYSVLLSFFTGKYHKPVVERRIFMFLDMKRSTVIAEKLGHDQYFKLLFDYYDLMSSPIINHYGEVYQYIGDEVVVTWKEQLGLTEQHCIRCFFEIKNNLSNKASYFEEKYGIVPDFKAGQHLGEVTTGIIGALKKETVFVGDVLNVSARIQGLCNEYQSDIIISQDLLDSLDSTDDFETNQLGEITLKGKSRETGIYSVISVSI